MRIWLVIILGLIGQQALAVEAVRLKDLGRFDGTRENYLVGYGVVTGLAGTGDTSRSKATRQSVANLLSNFGVSITTDQVNSRNVAIVSIMASLPAVNRRGDKVDAVVTSLGDATSLVGGTLLLTSLKGPDGKIYALVQGPVSIGGYRYDQNGNVAQKNHPTVGMIPSGAQIEKEILSPLARADGSLDFILNTPDFTTVRRIATAINTRLGESLAKVRDSGAVHIEMPAQYRRDPSSMLALIEAVEVTPDPRATIVINERTGTIIAGGDVRISKVTVAHGDLKVTVLTDYAVSQPLGLNRPGANIRTEVVPNSRIEVAEGEGGVIEVPENNSVADLLRALNRVKASTRDIIAILQGIKAAGALHADLVIQ
jgi:flagellar P-ring protein precursor FlgI